MSHAWATGSLQLHSVWSAPASKESSPAPARPPTTAPAPCPRPARRAAQFYSFAGPFDDARHADFQKRVVEAFKPEQIASGIGPTTPLSQVAANGPKVVLLTSYGGALEPEFTREAGFMERNWPDKQSLRALLDYDTRCAMGRAHLLFPPGSHWQAAGDAVRSRAACRTMLARARELTLRPSPGHAPLAPPPAAATTPRTMPAAALRSR